MFELYHKDTLERTKIYTIDKDSCGYPKFLIRKGNQWMWKSAKWFITKEEYYFKMNRERNCSNCGSNFGCVEYSDNLGACHNWQPNITKESNK